MLAYGRLKYVFNELVRQTKAKRVNLLRLYVALGSPEDFEELMQEAAATWLELGEEPDGELGFCVAGRWYDWAERRAA